MKKKTVVALLLALGMASTSISVPALAEEAQTEAGAEETTGGEEGAAKIDAGETTADEENAVDAGAEEASVGEEAGAEDMTPEGKYNKAMEYQQQGNMEEGMKLLTESALEGYAEAQRILGEFNQSGDFAEPNYEEALKWDEMAVEQGNARAMTNMGILYLNGWGTDQDYGKALDLFTQATEAGDSKGPRYAGEMYENGLGMEQDYGKAVEYYQIAVEREDITGMYDLARMYENGTGIEQDYGKAAELYEASAQRDDHVSAASQLALGKMYASGQGVPQDMKKAVDYLTRAVNNGNEEAQGVLEGVKNTLKEMGYLDKMVNETRDAMLEETLDKFVQAEYTDEETGITLQYNLFTPENYDPSKEYPVVLFLHDASCCGEDPTLTLTQGYGAIVWATENVQAENECFVVAPQYERVIADDDFTVTEEADVTVRMLESLTEEYSMDEDRLYITGQSMGCMTAMELNIEYPDLFAASLYVAGQWDTSKMEGFAEDKILYMVSEGDAKAAPAMDEFEEMLKENDVSYASAVWNGKATEEENAAACEELFGAGEDINLVRFEKGTVLPEGAPDSADLEHVYTWDAAYLIDGVQDWLFAQSK